MASGWSTSRVDGGPTLREQCLDAGNLRRALEEVLANEQSDGDVPAGLRRLRDNADSELAQLAARLDNGDFRPSGLVEVSIPKPAGGVRTLSIPTAVDRVVERAVMQVVTPVLEPHLGPHSFGFRPGVGVGDAVRRVVALRDAGFMWVAHTDVDDCFASIDRQRLRRMLEVLIDDRWVLALLHQFFERPSITRDGRQRWPSGLPQGSPLSPLLCNLVLAGFDGALAAKGYPLVRYADDVLVLARSKEEAMAGLEEAAVGAAELGMRLGADKTEVIDFATGFSFLGEDFNVRYPAAAGDPVEVPDRRVLYVGLQGSYASVRSGRVVVTREKNEVLSAPTGHVSRVVAFGSVTLAPSLVSWALTSDVDVVLCSRRGSLLGVLAPSGATANEGRRRQFDLLGDAARRLQLAQRFVEGKLHNQRVLLQRRVQPDLAHELDRVIGQLKSYSAMVATATEPNELLGVEGIAARQYFEAFGALLPEELGFKGRATRPPADVVNAALGYGYAILGGECATALASAGLDASIGILHADRASRLSLALDLVEEFRPLIVDTVVLELARSGALTRDHGRDVAAGKGVLLTEAGRTALVAALERRLLTRVHHLQTGKKVTYRWAIHLQAQALKRAISRGAHEYRPMLWRV